MAQNLFSPDGLAAMTRYVTSDTLFAFDLDGTLAPIVDDYSAAMIDEPTRLILKKLLQLVKVAVITGRSRKDAAAILGFEPDILVGNHGAEWSETSTNSIKVNIDCINKWIEQLNDKLCFINGIKIELKGESLSIHYRNTEDHNRAIELITTVINNLVPKPRMIGGKYVFNLLPMDAITKGDALKKIMDILGVEKAIYFGDDVTDEEVFKCKGIDFLGIHIGEGETAAPYYLSKQSALVGLLNDMAKVLEWGES